MRNLLAEHLDEAATRRTVAAITERNGGDTRVASAADETDDADAKATRKTKPTPMVQSQGAIKVASTAPEPVPLPAPRAPAVPVKDRSRSPGQTRASGAGATRSRQARTRSAHQRCDCVALATIPGAAEPMTPVRVKTVQVRMGQTKVASAAPAADPAPVSTSAIPAPRKPDVAETSKAVVAKAEIKPDIPAEPKAERRAEPWPASYAQPRAEFPAPLQPSRTPATRHWTRHLSAAFPPLRRRRLTRRRWPTPILRRAARRPPRSVPRPSHSKHLQRRPAATRSSTRPAGGNPRSSRNSHRRWCSRTARSRRSHARAGSSRSARSRAKAKRGNGSMPRAAAPASCSATPSSLPRRFRKAARRSIAPASPGSIRILAEAACRTLKRSDISCIAIRN